MITTARPGIYSCVPNADYHAGPEISKSGLDLVARSPFHYWAAKLSPDRPKDAGTRSKFNGSAVHSAVLEPAIFPREFTSGPHVNRNTKEWKAFEAIAGGAVILKPDEFALVRRQADAVRTHPFVRELLAKGDPEQSAYWQDEEHGIACRARPDWLCLERGLIVDLKTTRSADPDDFVKSSWEFRYHVQAAWYRHGVTEALRQSNFQGPIPEFLFCIIAVESCYPHCVSVFTFNDDIIQVGEEQMRKDLATYAACTQSGIWPQYATDILSIDLPYWEKKKRT